MNQKIYELFQPRSYLSRMLLRCLLWTLLIAFFVLLGWFYHQNESLEIALGRARDSYNKDVVYRLWATQRGGVYVPLDEKTPANPYLKDLPDREITTTTGKTYTLVNPAYMTRMVHDLGKEMGLQGHITSLKPIRPENVPDEWERKALHHFETGPREYWEKTSQGNLPYLRYMGAFIVQDGCLHCHATQGYKVGDVRGGISVTVPLFTSQHQLGDAHERATLLGLGALWLVGLGAIVFVGKEEQRHAEAQKHLITELEASRATYQSLVNAVPMKLYRVDRQGKLSFLNTAFLHELGLPAEACLGKRASDLFPPPFAAKYQEDDARVLQGEIVHQVEDHPAPGTAQIRKVEVVKVPIFDAEGTVVGLQGIYWDVTEKAAAEAILRESNERFQTLIESCPLPIAVHQKGCFVYCNPAFLHLLGAEDPLQLLGRDILTFLHPDLHRQSLERIRRAIEEGQAAPPLEEKLLRLDGSSLEAEVRGFPIMLGGEQAMLVFAEELTERKRLAEEHRELEHHLQQAQKMESLGSLAGGVAHDMNNVLGAILGLASAHLEIQPPDSPAHRAFETISKACVRGGTLVKGLLAFAHQDLAENRELDLNTVIREEVQLLERTTLAKIHLEMALAPNLWPIRGDAGALNHALMNLCVNAVDAMPDSGSLTLRTRNVGPDWVEVEVEDTGSGMTPEVLEKAMEPFFTTKPTGKGTGLGLSIVFSTVKAHQGKLEIHSQPGAGTRVVLGFPASLAAPQTEGSPAELRPRKDFRPLSVFLVDDDELIQKSFAEQLKFLGHRATLASSGEEALAKLEYGLQPDVVILDMNMPGLGGVGTLPKLRALNPQVPVLLATGRVDQTALDLVQAHAGVTLLAKPFSLEELRQRLEELP